MRNRVSALIVLALFLAVTGCGGNPSPAPEVPETLRIRVITGTDPDSMAVRLGAEDAARRTTGSKGRRVVIDWMEAGDNPARRISDTNKTAADGIIVSLPGGDGVERAIGTAADGGLPTAVVGYPLTESTNAVRIGPDEVESGVRLMRELVGITGGTAHVAVLVGPERTGYLGQRVRGILEEARRHKGIEVVGTYDSTEGPAEAAGVVTKANGDNPRIDAWILAGGWPLRSPALLDLSPDRYRIVSMDALPSQLGYVDKGVVPVLLARPMYDWGYMAVGVLVERIDGVKASVPKQGLVRVTRANLGDWARHLGEWGYPGVPERYLTDEPNAEAGDTPANDAPETGTGMRTGA